jgi:hypothetical protein
MLHDCTRRMMHDCTKRMMHDRNGGQQESEGADRRGAGGHGEVNGSEKMQSIT